MEKPEHKATNDLLKMIDKATGLERTAIQIGTSEDGEPLGIIAWEARPASAGQHAKTPVSG